MPVRLLRPRAPVAVGLPTLLTVGAGLPDTCRGPAPARACTSSSQSLWLDDWHAHLLCALQIRGPGRSRVEDPFTATRPPLGGAGVKASLNVPRLLLEGTRAHFLVVSITKCAPHGPVWTWTLVKGVGGSA